MTHEDLTPDEREALELLRANAPEAPEALASLDEVGRARVPGGAQQCQDWRRRLRRFGCRRHR